MELRKDPITNSWVVVGASRKAPAPDADLPSLPGASRPPALCCSQLPSNGTPQVRVDPALLSPVSHRG